MSEALPRKLPVVIAFSYEGGSEIGSEKEEGESELDSRMYVVFALPITYSGRVSAWMNFSQRLLIHFRTCSSKRDLRRTRAAVFQVITSSANPRFRGLHARPFRVYSSVGRSVGWRASGTLNRDRQLCCFNENIVEIYAFLSWWRHEVSKYRTH